MTRFVEDISRAADAHRNALGFVPRSVFEEFARRDHLYVLVEANENSSIYFGHLMFRCRFPRAQIVQMFTLPERRRAGMATKLLNYLCDSLTDDGFTSIYARVAEDLTDANAFWECRRFYVQRTESGGATKKRHILVRCHELSTPQLFPTSGINESNPLGIAAAADSVPLYLLDLNVLYDIERRRFRRGEALSLFQAERMNFCQLAVSSEVSEELRRTAHVGKTDPMEAYVSVFPSLPFQKGESSDSLLTELAKIVFPSKERLKSNDKSDLRHLATVIQHKIAGLITVGHVTIASIHASSPAKLWQKYGTVSGLSRMEFFEYFRSAANPVALLIEEVKRYRSALSLGDIRRISDGFQPPQFFSRIQPHHPVLAAVGV